MNINQQLSAAWQRHQTGDLDSAEQTYRKILADQPTHASAWVYLGIALFDRRQFDQATQAYRKAIHFQNHFPIAWNNLGNAYRMLGKIDQADECFATALEQQPGYLSALKNRGTLWVWSGEMERGLRWYREALQTNPDEAELHRNLGVIELLRGNYDIGWDEYRYRWKMPGMRRPRTTAGHWQGQPLSGKRFLLYPEQGLGDQLHFVRVAHQLSSRGADVVLQCPAKLVNLLSSTTETLGVSQLVVESNHPIQADYHASMIEVVDVLYGQTGEIAYGTDCFGDRGYLYVAQPLIEYWGQWLDGQRPCVSKRVRVGINWQGNPEHHADVYRSVPLSTFERLARHPEIDLVNLQFGDGLEQLESCSFEDQVLRLPDDLDQEPGSGFADTAAIIENLDAVVTTDTAVAHLAGAVGRETHLMLGRIPDWRWLTHGDQTAWYPQMKLYRQARFGHWDDVMDQIAKSIVARFHHKPCLGE